MVVLDKNWKFTKWMNLCLISCSCRFKKCQKCSSWIIIELSLVFQVCHQFLGGFKTEPLDPQPSQPELETQRPQQTNNNNNNNSSVWSNLVTSTVTSCDSDDKRKIHKCDFPTCDKVYTKSSHLKAHKRNPDLTFHYFSSFYTWLFFLSSKVSVYNWFWGWDVRSGLPGLTPGRSRTSAPGRAAPGSLPGVTSSPDTTGNIQVS